eukprot:1076758-Amphidinium_carterae.1
MRFTAYEDEDLHEITAIYVCPEIRMGATLSFDFTAPQQSDFFTPASSDPDAQLCVSEISFLTDQTLDTFTSSEPFASICFAGSCKRTKPESVEWDCPCAGGFSCRTLSLEGTQTDPPFCNDVPDNCALRVTDYDYLGVANRR